MEYGKIVTANKMYVRRTIIKEGRRFKHWVLTPQFTRGIYLGKRTLQNGYIEWQDDEGWLFYSSEFIKVALVSPSEHKNPIYVPLVEEVTP